MDPQRNSVHQQQPLQQQSHQQPLLQPQLLTPQHIQWQVQQQPLSQNTQPIQWHPHQRQLLQQQPRQLQPQQLLRPPLLPLPWQVQQQPPWQYAQLQPCQQAALFQPQQQQQHQQQIQHNQLKKYPEQHSQPQPQHSNFKSKQLHEPKQPQQHSLLQPKPEPKQHPNQQSSKGCKQQPQLPQQQPKQQPKQLAQQQAKLQPEQEPKQESQPSKQESSQQSSEGCKQPPQLPQQQSKQQPKPLQQQSKLQPKPEPKQHPNQQSSKGCKQQPQHSQQQSKQQPNQLQQQAKLQPEQEPKREPQSSKLEPSQQSSEECKQPPQLTQQHPKQQPKQPQQQSKLQPEQEPKQEPQSSKLEPSQQSSEGCKQPPQLPQQQPKQQPNQLQQQAKLQPEQEPKREPQSSKLEPSQQSSEECKQPPQLTQQHPKQQPKQPQQQSKLQPEQEPKQEPQSSKLEPSQQSSEGCKQPPQLLQQHPKQQPKQPQQQSKLQPKQDPKQDPKREPISNQQSSEGCKQQPQQQTKVQPKQDPKQDPKREPISNQQSSEGCKQQPQQQTKVQPKQDPKQDPKREPISNQQSGEGCKQQPQQQTKVQPKQDPKQDPKREPISNQQSSEGCKQQPQQQTKVQPKQDPKQDPKREPISNQQSSEGCKQQPQQQTKVQPKQDPKQDPKREPISNQQSSEGCKQQPQQQTKVQPKQDPKQDPKREPISNQQSSEGCKQQTKVQSKQDPKQDPKREPISNQQSSEGCKQQPQQQTKVQPKQDPKQDPKREPISNQQSGEGCKQQPQQQTKVQPKQDPNQDPKREPISNQQSSEGCKQQPQQQTKVQPKQDPKQDPKREPISNQQSSEGCKQQPQQQTKVQPKQDPKQDPKREPISNQQSGEGCKQQPQQQTKVQPKQDPKREPISNQQSSEGCKQQPQQQTKVQPKQDPKQDPKREPISNQQSSEGCKQQPQQQTKVQPKQEPKLEPQIPKQDPNQHSSEGCKQQHQPLQQKLKQPQQQPKLQPKQEPKQEQSSEECKQQPQLPKCQPKQQPIQQNQSATAVATSTHTGQQLSMEAVELFKRECIKVLKKAKHSGHVLKVQVSQFPELYHKCFGWQFSLARYGAKKTLQLFEAIPEDVKITGEKKKFVELIPVLGAQQGCRPSRKTLTRKDCEQRIEALLYSLPDHQVILGRFMAQYERMFGEKLTSYFGHPKLISFLEDLTNSLQIQGKGPNRIISLHPTRLFACEIVELLSAQPGGSLAIGMFAPTYTEMFNQDFVIGTYGYSKLIDALEAIPDVIDIRGVEPSKTMCLKPNKRTASANSKSSSSFPDTTFICDKVTTILLSARLQPLPVPKVTKMYNSSCDRSANVSSTQMVEVLKGNPAFELIDAGPTQYVWLVQESKSSPQEYLRKTEKELLAQITDKQPKVSQKIQATKEMSPLLFAYIKIRYEDKVKEFEQRGGSLIHRNGNAVVTAPTQAIADQFSSDIFSDIEEFKMNVTPDQWSELVTKGPDGKTMFGCLHSPNPNIRVHLQCSEQAILFTGSCTAVQSACKCFMNELGYNELKVDRLKMQTLLHLMPKLDRQISEKFDVEMENFETGSCVIKFQGPPTAVNAARLQVESKLSQFVSKRIAFQHAPVLFRSVQKRLLEDAIHVYVCTTDNATSADLALRLHVCSFSQTELSKALSIFRKPFVNYVAVSSPSILSAIYDEFWTLEKEHNVIIHQLPSQESEQICIQGFIKEDVQLVCRHVKGLTAEKTVPLKCSKEEMNYLNLTVFIMKTTEAKSLLLSLQSLGSVQMMCQRGQILLFGTHAQIDQAQTVILRSPLLHGLLCRTFSFDKKFQDQIVKVVVQPMKKKKKLDIMYYLPKYGSQHQTIVFIFSKNHAHFEKACKLMDELNPQSKTFAVEPGSEKLLSTFLDTQAYEKYRCQIYFSKRPTPAVLINGLSPEDIESCWREMEEYIFTHLEVTRSVTVNDSQLKYLLQKHSKYIEQAKRKCTLHFPPSTQSSIESNLLITVCGRMRHVEEVVQRIETTVSQCKTEEFQIECPARNIRLWENRWQEFSQEQQEKHNFIIEVRYSQSVSEPPQADSNSSTPVTFVMCGADSVGMERVKQQILREENGQSKCIRKLELSEYQMIILLHGLSSTLDLEAKYPIIIDVDSESNLVTLYSLPMAETQLINAEREVIKYICDNSQSKVFTFSDTVTGSLFTSHSLLHLAEIKRVCKQNQVLFYTLSHPCPGIRLTGSQKAIERVEQCICSMVDTLKSSITCDQLIVRSSYLQVFSTLEFAQFDVKLQKEFGVVCTYPTPGRNSQVLRHVLLQHPSSCHAVNFQICKGSLIHESVDAIVNKSKEDLYHRDGLAKMVSDAGGASIQAECTKYVQRKGKVRPGTAVCLGSGSLPCKKLIHAVGQQTHEKEFNKGMFHATVAQCLECAERERFGSIAFPAMVNEDTTPVTTPAAFLGAAAKAVFNVLFTKRPQTLNLPAVFLKAVYAHFLKNPHSFLHTIRIVLSTEKATDDFLKAFDADHSFSYLEHSKTKAAKPSTITTISCQWFWENDTKSPTPYPGEISDKLTAAYAMTPTGSFSYQIETKCYKIDFQTMTQRNSLTGFTRKVKYVQFPTKVRKRDENDASNLAISMQGPRKNLQEAKTKLEKKLETWVDKSKSEIPLPSMSCASKLQLKEIAEKHDVTYTIQEERPFQASPTTFVDWSTWINTPQKESKFVLKVEGCNHLVQRAVTEIQAKIIEFQSLHVSGDSKVSLPPEWKAQTKTFELFSLQSFTQEWIRVAAKFRATMPVSQAKITQIKRIQNKYIWEKYAQEKKRMEQKNAGRVNEIELFHRTSSTEPELIYASEVGFDMRYSANGLWGEANYFAVNARYSDAYAHTTRGYGYGIKKTMFLAKVLTGDSCTISQDRALRMPPLKQRGTDSEVGLKQMRYDSVTGHTNGSYIYMTYSNNQAYPAYLIQYEPVQFSS